MQHSADSSPTASPPPRSRSFTSLSPSDSRSNYPTQRLVQQQQQQQQPQEQEQQQLLLLQQQTPRRPSKLTLNTLTQHHSPSSNSLIPIGIRPQDLDISSIDDPDELFVNFTIREIRSIEQRARADADQRREDLRQMVGERYRDLLGAADSIVRMKLSAESLLEKLDQARSESDRTVLKSRAEAAGNSHKRSHNGSSKLSYVLATLVRLLLDLSEHVWRSLEREDFLTASRYVSLGRIISNELTTGNWDKSGTTEPSEVIEMFPIVERQSDTLGQLGPQISHKAKLFLRKWQVKNQVTLEALAAITLLDNTTLLDSLQLLLQVRNTGFRTLLASLSGSWTEHVRNAVKLLVATLANVRQIFLENEFVNLLKAIQDGSSSKEMHLKPLFSLLPNPHQLMRYIPKSIIEFSPFVATPLIESKGTELQEALSITKTWFENCQLELLSFIDQKLSHVQTAESLVEFRYQLHHAIGQLDGEFESILSLFRSRLMVSLDKRFYELYQCRLTLLKDEIIQSLSHPPSPPPSNQLEEEEEENNWIFNRKLPLLEPNDASKFNKYLTSIQRRIQGKFINIKEEEDDEDEKSNNIVSKMEKVSRLLKQDFQKWNNHHQINSSTNTNNNNNNDDDEKQVKIYIDLGKKFIFEIIKELQEKLNLEKNNNNNNNLKGELNIGNLVLQILSTRNTFMLDISLVNINDNNNFINEKKEEEEEEEGRGNELIDMFEDGLIEILHDSSRNWSFSIVQQAVSLFNNNSDDYFKKSNQEGKEKMIKKPSSRLNKTLNFIIQTIINNFNDNNNDDDDDDEVRYEIIFFDLFLLFSLFESFFLHSHHHDSFEGFKKLEELIHLFTNNEKNKEEEGNQDDQDESNNKFKKKDKKDIKKIKKIKENVIKFKSTITRLWWPFIPINQENQDREKEDDDFNLKSKEINSISDNNNNDNKVFRFGGLECVKPGNRFALLSVY